MKGEDFCITKFHFYSDRFVGKVDNRFVKGNLATDMIAEDLAAFVGVSFGIDESDTDESCSAGTEIKQEGIAVVNEFFGNKSGRYPTAFEGSKTILAERVTIQVGMFAVPGRIHTETTEGILGFYEAVAEIAVSVKPGSRSFRTTVRNGFVEFMPVITVSGNHK